MVEAYRRMARALRPRTVTTHEGGVAFEVDVWARLRRFLILGSEGGTFYVSEQRLTRESAAVVSACLAEDAERTVAAIVEISAAGRAPKNDPAIFALAMASASDDPAARKAALAALPAVCRTGTHLFRFATYAGSMRGWGRGLRRAVGAWYDAQPPRDLAYQLVKYRQRDGWTHADLLRLSHPKADDPGRNALYRWVVDAELVPELAEHAPEAAAMLTAFAQLQALPTERVADAVQVIRAHRLPREAIPTGLLGTREIWAALLDDMPMTALLRNLGTMSKVGLLEDGSDAARTVVDRLADADRLRRARVHPLAVLAALKVYGQGRGVRSDAAWRPVTAVVDALDAAFYAAFGNVEPTGKRVRLALDISGSMDGGRIAGLSFLSAREVSACMALVTAAVEPDHEFVAYSHTLVPVTISPRQRLDDVVARLREIPMGGTFCALPVIDALRRRRPWSSPVELFVSYTDNETWDASGRVAGGGLGSWARDQLGELAPEKPMADYLEEYRQATGIPVRSVVVATTATRCSLADPADPLSLDVVGFDTATPQILSDFARGRL